MTYRIVVNGLDHAFLSEFGCTCGRCLWQRPLANTSVSVLGLSEGGEVAAHLLFDVGAGVVNSLTTSLRLGGHNARLDMLLLSHWHPDHVLDLNRLCETWRRRQARQGAPRDPLPTWCRSGTMDWLRRTHPYELTMLGVTPSNEYEPAGTLLPAIGLGMEGLTVTPVAVSHGTADRDPGDPARQLACSAAFVVETSRRKTLFLWDMDNQNDWIVTPSTPGHVKAKEKMAGADYVFMDCNTWEEESPAGKNTGHVSFRTVLEYTRALRLKDTSETVLLHLSGHEDGQDMPGWGWDDLRWQNEAARTWAEQGMPGAVRVPKIGDEFIL